MRRSPDIYRRMRIRNCSFWSLTHSLPDAYYISVNAEYDFLPEQIEDRGSSILGDIGKVLVDVNAKIKQLECI